jgi:two-component system CheB/CheR fusion protein
MNAFPIVAVASSAGDLAAVSELVSALPAGYRAAFIIVQHVVSGREKLLSDALGKKTMLPLVHLYGDALAEPGHIYLITANTTLLVSDGRILVTADPGGLHHPGDLLFTSLAEECAASAIGIVLSGEGFDGALGVQSLKARGGATLAQYPGSARFPGMPINAIETGCVQFVLRPNEIARECARLSRHAAAAAAGLEFSRPASEVAAATQRANSGSAAPMSDASGCVNPELAKRLVA